MSSAIVAAAPRIAKCIALLASDRDHEVLASVRALRRTLASTGSDFNDLAAVITRAEPHEPPTPREPRKPLRRSDIPQPVLWLESLRRSQRLTDWERDFASSIHAQIRSQPWRTLLPKQVGVLDRILLKIVAEERR